MDKCTVVHQATFIQHEKDIYQAMKRHGGILNTYYYVKGANLKGYIL